MSERQVLQLWTGGQSVAAGSNSIPAPRRCYVRVATTDGSNIKIASSGNEPAGVGTQLPAGMVEYFPVDQGQLVQNIAGGNLINVTFCLKT